MENLRTGIGLHAYGQRDPLVVYRTEGHKTFQELLRRMQADVAHSLFHVVVTPQPSRPPGTDGNGRAGGNGTTKDTPMKQFSRGNKAAPTGNKIGRNAPCPCGSGKKYKRCCGANV